MPGPRRVARGVGLEERRLLAAERAGVAERRRYRRVRDDVTLERDAVVAAGLEDHARTRRPAGGGRGEVRARQHTGRGDLPAAEAARAARRVDGGVEWPEARPGPPAVVRCGDVLAPALEGGVGQDGRTAAERAQLPRRRARAAAAL